MLVVVVFTHAPVFAEGGAGQIAGTPRVVDGDTIAFGKVRVRLFGIDAPERSASGGKAATEYLRGTITGAVMCAVVDSDRYGRPVALCRSGGVDLSEAMLRACHADLLTKWFRVVPVVVRERLRAAAGECVR
jgi:endonuclease YncB( thermonuclease family)